MTFEVFLKKRRKKLGLTQKELSERLLINPSTISCWERGYAYPTVDAIHALSVVFGLRPVTIFSKMVVRGHKRRGVLASNCACGRPTQMMRKLCSVCRRGL